MIDVTPLVREAQAPVRKAAEIYIRHTRDWFVGLLAFGSAVKGSIIPGCSDIDLKLYLDDSVFASKWQLPLEVSIAIHRDLSRVDPSPFGYFQCHALPRHLVADHPIARIGPVPGAYHVLAGELPVPEASADEIRADATRILVGLEPMPFDIPGDLIEHGSGRLDRTVRLLCTKVWPVMCAVAGYRADDPLVVWRLRKDEVISLLPEGALSSRIHEFYRSVLTYYVTERRTVDAGLTLVERGVEFLTAATEWYAVQRDSGDD